MRSLLRAAGIALLALLLTACATKPPGPTLNPVDYLERPGGQAVELVVAGDPRATVVVPDGSLKDRRAVEPLAARDFVDCVQVASGAELKIVEAADAPATGDLVVIGDTPLGRAQGIHAEDLPKEGFRVQTCRVGDRDVLVIVGPATHQGTGFGVGDVLERYVGVRWYYPQEHGRVVPKRDTLVIAPTHYTDAPALLKRTGLPYRGPGRELAPFHFRTGNSSAVGGSPCHSPGSWEVHRDHPETFQLGADGQRAHKMPCYGNPKTAELYLQDLEAFYTDGKSDVWVHPWPQYDSLWYPPTARVIPISPPDQGVDCHCEYCRPLYDREGPRQGRASRIVAQHVKWVAEGVKERWPDKLVWYLPYSNYTVPPADVEFPDNVVVGVCLMHGAANAKEPTLAANHDRWIRQWATLTGRPVHLWEYLCWPTDDTSLPFQYPHVLQDFYRRHRDTVEGSFVNFGYAPHGLAGGNYAMSHPTIYCWYRLMWDPDFDVDGAIDEQVHLLYGPAARPMGKIIGHLTTRWEDTRWERPPPGHHVSPKQIHEETMPRHEALKLAKWLAEARELAGAEGLHRQRVDFLGAAVDIFLEESRSYHDEAGVKALAVLKVGGDPVVDGKLDETAWQDAAKGSFVHATDPETPEPPAPTTVQAVWTARGVTFGFHLTEPNMDKLRTNRTRHDQDIYNDDCIEIFLDVQGDRSEYRQIVVNPLAVAFDRHSRDGVEWNLEGLETAVHRGPDFWSLEVFVPFAAFADLEPPKIGDRWYANFTRSRRAGPVWLTRWSTRYQPSNLDFTAFGQLRFVE